MVARGDEPQGRGAVSPCATGTAFFWVVFMRPVGLRAWRATNLSASIGWRAGATSSPWIPDAPNRVKQRRITT